MKKVQIKLFIDNKEIETISVNKEHFINGQHPRNELVDKMLERMSNSLDMEVFNVDI